MDLNANVVKFQQINYAFGKKVNGIDKHTPGWEIKRSDLCPCQPLEIWEYFDFYVTLKK